MTAKYFVLSMQIAKHPTTNENLKGKRENGTGSYFGSYFVIGLTKRLFGNILKVVKKWETVWA
jgi:ribonuclease HIII